MSIAATAPSIILSSDCNVLRTTMNKVSAVHEAMDQESERLGPKQRRSCELGPDSLHKRKQRRSHDGRNTCGLAIIRSHRPSAIKMKPPTSRGCLRIPKQSYDV